MNIGITTPHRGWPATSGRQKILQRYLDVVTDAGAVPVPLWMPRHDSLDRIRVRAARMSTVLDGLIVSGGSDIDPRTYGEEILPFANVRLVNPRRTAFERLLAAEMRKRRKPMLGICYGCQLFNVWAGGSLYQDIPSQIPNVISHRRSRHVVRLQRHSALHRMIGHEEFEIASCHHQAIARIGNRVTVTGRAPDGIVEAIEVDALLVGVQWHPEWDRDHETTRRLFEAFATLCRTGALRNRHTRRARLPRRRVHPERTATS